MSEAQAGRFVDFQGHRGARGLRPESTLPSFEIALDQLSTTLEFDLHFTKDAQIVVWHDEVLTPEKCSRGPKKRPLRHPISIRTMTAAQVVRCVCDRNPDPVRFPDQRTEATVVAGKDFHVITLQELFDFVVTYSNDSRKSPEQRANARKVRFNMETKRKPEFPEFIGDNFDGENPGPFETKIVEMIRQNDLEQRVSIQSFDFRSLFAVRKIAPDIRLVALEKTRGEISFTELSEKGISFWSPNHEVATAELIAAAKDAGLLVVPWTVNDPDRIAELLEAGVDGVISDRPDLFPVVPKNPE